MRRMSPARHRARQLVAPLAQVVGVCTCRIGFRAPLGEASVITPTSLRRLEMVLPINNKDVSERNRVHVTLMIAPPFHSSCFREFSADGNKVTELYIISIQANSSSYFYNILLLRETSSAQFDEFAYLEIRTYCCGRSVTNHAPIKRCQGFESR